MSESPAPARLASRRTRPEKGRQRRPQLNLPWLIGSLLLLLLLVPTVYLWHARQVRRVAAALSTEADRWDAAGDHAQAARYLYRLLQMQPQDPQRTDTLVRLAQTYDRSVTHLAGKSAVIQWYYRAVGAAPQRLELQLRLAELFLETNQFVLAAEQAESILADQPGQPQALRLRALAHFGQFRQGRPLAVAQVMQELQEVQQTEPGDVAIAQTLASLYRETPPATEANSFAQQADAVMAALVDDASGDFRVYLARYRYRVRYGEEAEADADLQRALELAPAEPQVLLAAAQRAQMRRDYDRAAGLYRQLAKADPSDAAAYLGWGDCLYRQADLAGAVQAWQTGRESVRSARLPLGLRLAGALIELDRLAEAAQQLQDVSAALGRLTARQDLSQRDALIASRDLLAAKLALAQQRPQQAIDLLQRVATTAKRQAGEQADESTAYQAWLLLGQTQLQLQQWEDAVNSFQRALQIVPHSAVARLGAARAWLALGREDQALEICEQAVQRAAVPTDLWRILAQLQLDRQLRLPPADRQWETVQQTLEKAQFAIPDAWEIQLAQAQMLLARDGSAAVGAAMEILLAAEQTHRNVLPLWLNLVFVYENLGRQADADRALQRVQALAEDPLQAQAWRAVLLGLRGQYEEAAQLLEAGDSAADSPSAWLQRARLLLAYQKGIARDVHDALLSLLEAQPENTQWLAQLAELALSQRRGAEADRWISRLQEVEGSPGVLWKFFQARRLALRMRSADGPDMERIDRLMSEIRHARPDWPGLAWLQGLVAELRGRPDEAIDAFSTAIRAGFRQEELWQRLVRLLHRQGRFAEAEQWLVQLKQPSSFGPAVQEMSWGGALQTQRLAWAIERAQEEATLHPQDASAQAWLARLLLLDDRPAEAKVALQRARDLNPQDAATLIGLLASYLRVGETSAARTVMERLAEHPDLAPPDRQLLLAQAYESLGERELAQQHYEAATSLAPDRVDLQVQYAKFLQPLAPEQAEEVLRAALRQDPEQVEARRLLATWLLWRVDPQAREESYNLLRREPSGEEQRASDQRLQAVLLLRRGSSDDLREARQALEELVRDPAHVTLEDHWLLAGLYEREGQMAEAEQQLRLLVDRAQPTARHLVAWIEFLLRRQRPEEAQQWLAQLQQQTTLGWPTMVLRARVLQQLGQVDQIEAELEAFANPWLQQAPEAERQQRFMGQLAELYAAVGLHGRRRALVCPTLRPIPSTA